MLTYLVYIGECTLYFLANVLPEIQNANLLLQRECTTGVNLHGIISNLLRKLKNRLNDEFFGCKVSQLMEDYPHIASFFSTASQLRAFTTQLSHLSSQSIGCF